MYTNKNICAPGRRKDNTCFSHNALKELARAYNKKHKAQINLNQSKNKLWKDIRSNVGTKCNNEVCWTTLDFIKELDYKIKAELKNHTFLPIIPKGKHEWLSTTDIDYVIEQFEELQPQFKYMSSYPIDFARTDINSLLQLKPSDIIKQYKRNKKTFGIVFNTDKHTCAGKHWIAMFIDTKSKTIEFFDSYGHNPPKEIQTFMNKLQKEFKDKLNLKMKLRVNRKRHQFKNSECGVYSIHFVVQRLLGNSFDQVVNDIIDDDTMNGNRNVYFRPSNYIVIEK